MRINRSRPLVACASIALTGRLYSQQEQQRSEKRLSGSGNRVADSGEDLPIESMEHCKTAASFAASRTPSYDPIGNDHGKNSHLATGDFFRFFSS